MLDIIHTDKNGIRDNKEVVLQEIIAKTMNRKREKYEDLSRKQNSTSNQKETCN